MIYIYDIFSCKTNFKKVLKVGTTLYLFLTNMIQQELIELCDKIMKDYMVLCLPSFYLAKSNFTPVSFSETSQSFLAMFSSLDSSPGSLIIG